MSKDNSWTKLMSRRAAMQTMLGAIAGSATMSLLPSSVLAQSGVGDIIIHCFLYGGADGQSLFPAVSGQFADIMRNERRPDFSVPLDDTITFQELEDSQRNRFGYNVGLHFGWQALVNEAASNMRIITNYGDTTKQASRSHSDATTNMQQLSEGSMGTTPGMLARAANAFNVPNLGFYSLDGSSRVVSGGNIAPINIEDAENVGFDRYGRGYWECGSDCPDADRVVRGWEDTDLAMRYFKQISAMKSQGNEVQELYRDSRQLIEDSVETVREILERPLVGNYGNGGFANEMREAARLAIFGATDPGIRPFIKLLACGRGGWDMHSNILPGMANAVPDVANALRGFVQDMKAAGVWTNVTLIISSEFGRTTAENASDGVDHAEGSNTLVLGGKVRGGRTGGSYNLNEARNSNAFSPEIDTRALFYGALLSAGVNPDAVFDPGEWNYVQGINFHRDAFTS